MSLADTDIAILCGGLGTRLIPAALNRPKVLAPILGRPYLDWLCDDLVWYGARRIILLGGHLSEMLWDWLAPAQSKGLKITLFNEPERSGTAGAVRQARHLLKSNPVLVINGDTLVTADLDEFLDNHIVIDCIASTLSAFIWNTKQIEYAGHYLLSQHALDRLVTSEHEGLHEFMAELQSEKLAQEYLSGEYLDIGKPEDLVKASAFIKEKIGDHQQNADADKLVRR